MAVRNPFDQFDNHAPAPTAQRSPFDAAAPVAQQAPANDQQAAPRNPFDAVAQDVPETPNAGSYDDGFNTPEQPHTQLAPEDEAALHELFLKGTSSQITQFLAAHGFQATRSVDEYVAQRDKAHGAGVGPQAGVVYTFPDTTQIDQSRVGGAAGAVTRGALDALTLGTASKGAAAIRALQDGGDFGEAYGRERDMSLGVKQQDEREHPWMRLGGELLGGAALPVGLERVGLQAGADVLRSGGTMEAARTAAAAAVRNRAMQVGGGLGAGHGVLSADDPAHALTGGLTEGALGAGTAGVLGQLGVVRANASRVPPQAPTEAQQLMAAAERRGIDVLPADVAGPVVRRATSATTQTIAGGQPIIAAGQRIVDQARAARDRTAAQIGRTLRPEAAGQSAIRGAQSFITRTGGRANTLYRAAEAEANGASVTPTLALAALDRNIADLSQVPGGADGLARLQALREALAAGDVTVTGMRGMRTALRDGFTSDGLRGSDIERRVNQVIDASTQDVSNGLNAQGRGQAARLYQTADRYYRQRIDTIDNVIEPMIGNKSGEQVVKTLTADLQGNNARAVRFLRALPPEEQGDVRASIIGAMGRATKGTQNAEGNAFSLSTFLTNWDEVGDTAKRAYFGPEARAALDDLARVASGAREAAGYANRSNTGGAVGNLMTLGTGFAGMPALAATVAGQFGLGRMLASPRFARWLARAPRTQLAPTAYIDRLSRIARAEPAIANEVLQLQQHLERAFSSSPTRLAAQEPANESGEAQRNQGGNQNAQADGPQP